MINAEYRFTLPIAPEIAFDYLSNPENDSDWQSSCAECILLDDGPKVGCRYQIVFSFLGRKMNFQAEITDMDVPNRYGFRVVEGPFKYEGRYHISSHPDGAEVHWQFDAEPGRFFGILPVGLIKKVLISQVEKDSTALRKRFLAESVLRASV